MTRADQDSSSERVLILAPTGRDAQVLAEALASAGILAFPCPSMGSLVSEIPRGVGVMMVAEEGLTPASLEGLMEALADQPSWSDIPIIVPAARGEASDALMRAVQVLAPSGNITVLERPVQRLTVVMAVQAGLRARRRQYGVRQLLGELESQTTHLLAEKDMRERFVSLLAHDLRGPLATAKLSVQMLLRTTDPLDRGLDLKLRIDRNLDRIDQMIRDLLDVSRIRAGQRLPLRIDECDIGEVCHEVLEELNQAHPGRFIFSGENKVRGFWSAEELRRAIWNLATNAVKYGARGTPVVVLLQPFAHRVVLSVHNEGPAIPAEEQATLFEPYRRSRERDVGRPRGWGLGLTLVRGCAEAHGGTVHVVSEPRRGTTFTLSLPWDSRALQPTVEEPRDASDDASPHRLH